MAQSLKDWRIGSYRDKTRTKCGSFQTCTFSYSLNLRGGTGIWTEPTLFRMREAKKVAAPSESQRASHQRGVTKLPNQTWESSWATTLLLRTRRSSPSQFGLYSTADGLKHGGEWTLWVNIQPLSTTFGHAHLWNRLRNNLRMNKNPIWVLGYFVG